MNWRCDGLVKRTAQSLFGLSYLTVEGLSVMAEDEQLLHGVEFVAPDPLGGFKAAGDVGLQLFELARPQAHESRNCLSIELR
jgi:hypothetical protein